MFKLIKWAMYGLLGYALYELYLGVMEQQGRGQGMGGGQNERSQSSGQGGRMTGGGSGKRERSEESSSGMSTPHAVGRGVVS